MHFDLYMWDLISANGNIVIQTRFDDDLHVLSYHKASDLEELTKCDENMTINAVSPAGDYFIMYSSKDGYVFYDMDAKPFYTFREDQSDYLVCFSFDGPVVNAFCSKALYIIDPVEKKTEKISYQEMGIDFNISAVNVSDNKKFAALLQGKYLYYVDCEKQSCIKKYTADTTIAGVITENDGQHVYVSEYGNSLYELDINTLDKRGLFSEEIMPVKDILNYDILKISPDHTMLAMLCGDYQLRILDIKTGELISTFPAKFRSFAYLNFSKDNRYIYIQTDDFVFRIWDIKNGKFVCCCDTINAMFKYEMYDENSKRVAFGNCYDLYVFDTENNGMVAEISDGIAYMANNSFILYKNRQLYRTYYKDYRKLLEEIGKQFTDTELSQEERVRYNIN